MEMWTEVRRRVLTGELSKRAACQEYGINWRTLTKMLAHAEPPGYRRKAQREIETVIVGVQQQENTELRLPSKGEWSHWVENHFAGDGSHDPWGNVYQYDLWPDSFAVTSNGPDRIRKTADDIRDVRIRAWQAKGEGKP